MKTLGTCLFLQRANRILIYHESNILVLQPHLLVVLQGLEMYNDRRYGVSSVSQANEGGGQQNTNQVLNNSTDRQSVWGNNIAQIGVGHVWMALWALCEGGSREAPKADRTKHSLQPYESYQTIFRFA